jgi:hypothetical protein
MTPQTRELGAAALAAWLVTASIGVFMLRAWVVRGGLRRQRATGVGVPPLLVFGHASTAVTGLVVWLCYLATHAGALAWLGVGVIAVAITLGICTVTLWTPYPLRLPQEALAQEALAQETGAAKPGPEPEHPWVVTDEMIIGLLTAPPRTSARHRLRLAPLVPVCHGFAALATFLLAALTAISALR